MARGTPGSGGGSGSERRYQKTPPSVKRRIKSASSSQGSNEEGGRMSESAPCSPPMPPAADASSHTVLPDPVQPTEGTPALLSSTAAPASSASGAEPQPPSTPPPLAAAPLPVTATTGACAISLTSAVASGCCSSSPRAAPSSAATAASSAASSAATSAATTVLYAAASARNAAASAAAAAAATAAVAAAAVVAASDNQPPCRASQGGDEPPAVARQLTAQPPPQAQTRRSIVDFFRRPSTDEACRSLRKPEEASEAFRRLSSDEASRAIVASSAASEAAAPITERASAPEGEHASEQAPKDDRDRVGAAAAQLEALPNSAASVAVAGATSSGSIVARRVVAMEPTEHQIRTTQVAPHDAAAVTAEDLESEHAVLAARRLLSVISHNSYVQYGTEEETPAEGQQSPAEASAMAAARMGGDSEARAPTSRQGTTSPRGAASITDEEGSEHEYLPFDQAAPQQPAPKTPSMLPPSIERQLRTGFELLTRSPWDALRALRARFLYHYAPFDLSFWGRMRSPASVTLFCLSSWPSWAMRTFFFALLFSFLLVDLDEYQLMQFIMSLKGTQFITGLFLALEGFVIFFSCSVFAQPSNCDVAGPGVGTAVPWQAFYQLALQGMTWAAFALLPYSTQCGEITLLGRRARAIEAARHAQDKKERKQAAKRAAGKRGGRAWREAAGRDAGQDGYQFGDVSRWLFRKIKGFDGAGAAAAAGGAEGGGGRDGDAGGNVEQGSATGTGAALTAGAQRESQLVFKTAERSGKYHRLQEEDDDEGEQPAEGGPRAVEAPRKVDEEEEEEAAGRMEAGRMESGKAEAKLFEQRNLMAAGREPEKLEMQQAKGLDVGVAGGEPVAAGEANTREVRKWWEANVLGARVLVRAPDEGDEVEKEEAAPAADECDRERSRWVTGRILSMRKGPSGVAQFKVSLDGYDSENDEWMYGDEERLQPYDQASSAKEAAKRAAAENERARLQSEARRHESRAALELATRSAPPPSPPPTPPAAPDAAAPSEAGSSVVASSGGARSGAEPSGCVEPTAALGGEIRDDELEGEDQITSGEGDSEAGATGAAAMGSDGSEHAVVGDSNAGWAGCFAACTQLTLRHNYGTNRILGLMKWDMLAFASCSALFFAILVALAAQDAATAKRAADSGDAPPVSATSLSELMGTAGARTGPKDTGGGDSGGVISVLDVLLNGAFWASWRVEISFFLCRLVYALSALPYLVFHLPGIRTLLSHTFATGFTENGQCVPHDSHGLSAFTKWLEYALRRGPPTLRDTLSEAEMAKLERMLADAKSTLGGGGRGRRFGVGGGADATGEGGKEGGNEGGGGGGGAVAKGVLDRKLKELEAELSRAFPPTHPAFPIIFPERLICREYESTLAEARVARRRAAAKQTSGAKQTFATWDEHQSAKYGVQWQTDASECSLCGASFSFFKRRHHCRSCGRLCCNACSRARRVPHKGAEVAKRACDRCVLAESERKSPSSKPVTNETELFLNASSDPYSLSHSMAL